VRQLRCRAAADKSENAYMAGATDEPDFPTTSGALQRSGRHIDSIGNTYYCSKISASGNLVYGTFRGQALRSARWVRATA